MSVELLNYFVKPGVDWLLLLEYLEFVLCVKYIYINILYIE